MKVAIITGGISGEREIALQSADYFMNHAGKHHIDMFDLPEELEDFLNAAHNYDMVLPIFHGEYGEDGKIHAMLDIFGIEYVGSPSFTHALCLNKKEANAVVSTQGILIPKEYIARHINDFPKQYPVIMKPNTGGSSLHTYKVENDAQFAQYYIAMQDDIDDDILVQEYICGEEYSLPVVAGELLPIMKLEKKEKNAVFDYVSKYEDNSNIQETFPEIPAELQEKFKSLHNALEDIFSLSGYYRIDIIVDNSENIYFIEINTIPGTSKKSILPQAWELTGRNGKELVDVILNS